MSETKPMGRREFIGAAAAALFAGVIIQVTGCTTDDNKTQTAPPKLNPGDLAGTISDNHADGPHAAIIAKAQLDAGGAVTLDIQGQANHTHSVSFTADEMSQIKSGLMVMKTSASGGVGAYTHTHVVMFN